MTIIANPIYDVVFKFMMEDEKVAKILFSSLLKKEIVSLEMRNQEFTSAYKQRISLFRMDFRANVKDADGKEQLIIIELQKTWLATENLRFRQYLGYQYIDESNVLEEESARYGMPLVSIYILGHKLGDFEEPIIYVKRDYLDYESKIISKGVPDKFIESLTHDSIIVQLPYLKTNVKNRLERLLSLFDQRNIVECDVHSLKIEDDSFDKDTKTVAHRLTQALVTPDVRRSMDIEDQFLSEIETRDTELMLREKKIEARNQAIMAKDQEIIAKDQAIIEKDQAIKSSIGLLIECGKTVEEISEKLSLDVVYIKSMM